MYAIVEWTHDAQCAPESALAAIVGPPRWSDDHLHGILFQTDKEYDFFAAVAGVRSRFDRPPLFPPRDLPNNLSGPARLVFAHCGDDTGGSDWLHSSEVDRAIGHVTEGPFHIGTELRHGLTILRAMAGEYGDEHVRLVFHIYY